MRAVAAGATLILVQLAATESHGLLGTVPDEPERLVVAQCLDMTHITEGLVLRLTAGAPPVLLARVQLDSKRFRLSNDR